MGRWARHRAFARPQDQTLDTSSESTPPHEGVCSFDLCPGNVLTLGAAASISVTHIRVWVCGTDSWQGLQGIGWGTRGTFVIDSAAQVRTTQGEQDEDKEVRSHPLFNEGTVLGPNHGHRFGEESPD